MARDRGSPARTEAVSVSSLSKTHAGRVFCFVLFLLFLVFSIEDVFGVFFHYFLIRNISCL